MCPIVCSCLVWFTCWLSISLSHFISPIGALLTPSSIENVCPGDTINVVCTVDGDVLQWLLPDPTGREVPLDVSFVTDQSGPLIGIPRNVTEDRLRVYTVTLNSISTNPPHLMSTLQVILLMSLAGQIIQCTGSSITVQFNDPPTTPQNARIVRIINDTDSSTVTIQWDPPLGAGVDNYTVSITPDHLPFDPNSTVMGAVIELVLNYNIQYTVSVVATNCAGSSDPSLNLVFNLVRCNVPTVPPNGRIEPIFNRTEGATLVFMCDDGYFPTEIRNTICLQDMSWSPDPGSLICTPIPTSSTNTASQMPPILCGLPRSPVNGSLGSHLPTSPLGTTVTFQCDEGLFPTDKKTATCRDMSGRGEWDPNPADLICSSVVVSGRSGVIACGTEVAVSVTITFIVSVMVGLALGMLLMYCAKLRQFKAQQQPTTGTGPVYEDVLPARENIELETNLAYGPVGH